MVDQCVSRSRKGRRSVGYTMVAPLSGADAAAGRGGRGHDARGLELGARVVAALAGVRLEGGVLVDRAPVAAGPVDHAHRRDVHELLHTVVPAGLDDVPRALDRAALVLRPGA